MIVAMACLATAGSRAGLGIAALLLLSAPVLAAEGRVSHGLSAFGELKYGADFRHFEYVDPRAPKGGEIKFWALESFDNLNPFILKGVAAAGAGLMFDSLMVRADDEPDAMYGLIAEAVELPDDRAWVQFSLRAAARWWDDTPITAADVVFSFETLIEKGHPSYRVLLRDVAGARALGPRLVRFEFKPGEHRDLPQIVAAMPVLSKAYWSGRDFARTTLEPPLASGPYRIAKVDPGRSIAYRRDPDYWARDLPVNRGRYNFDSIRFDYYRDRGIALEAFFAGEYDFREEFTSKSWATGYDKPPVRRGLILREVLPDQTPSGVQAFFLNSRRAKFADRRTREALGYAFDFGWTNKNIFHGLYKRTTSMFENSSLAAKAPPSPEELVLLEPFRGQVPDRVFERPFAPPKTDGSGNIRRHLRQALKLLAAAGWTVQDGKLRDAAGQQLTIEFLMFEPTFQRVIAPYIRNLERLGIEARMRIVDLANFEYRMEHFDFDITVRRYVQPLTPGIEQRGMWTSAYAAVVGANNIAGIANPVVDALVETVIGAKSRDELTTAARALDRVLMANHYVVPHWYKGSHTIAYWNKFSRPRIKPRYARGVLDTWWVDADKERLLAAGKAPPKG